MSKVKTCQNDSRRKFLIRTAYVAPVLLTLSTKPTFAGIGSHCNNGVGNGADCRPGMAYFNNDDNGGVPGHPGSHHGGHGGANTYD